MSRVRISRSESKRFLRNRILQKYDNRCAYCGCEVTLQTMQIDHIVPKCFGGVDHELNLNPSCKHCNNYKAHSHLEIFRSHLLQMINVKHEYLFKSNTKKQVAVNLGCIEIKRWDGVFYFEKVEY